MPLSDAILTTALSTLTPGRYPLCRIDVSAVEPPHRFQLAMFALKWRRLVFAPMNRAEMS